MVGRTVAPDQREVLSTAGGGCESEQWTLYPSKKRNVYMTIKDWSTERNPRPRDGRNSNDDGGSKQNAECYSEALLGTARWRLVALRLEPFLPRQGRQTRLLGAAEAGGGGSLVPSAVLLTVAVGVVGI